MVWDALNILSAWLCQTIYPLIAYVYKLFYNIGTLRIITDEKINPIYNRITLILGLVMLFVITFQLIQYIMEPDNFNDKEKGFGKVMVRMVISVALIALVPQMFNFAFDLQKDIMSNDLIPKIILGSSNDTDENWGRAFSRALLNNFYKVNPNLDNPVCDNPSNSPAIDIVNANLTDLTSNGRLGSALGYCLNEKAENNDKEDKIQFDGIIAVLSGGLVLWMLGMYCLDLGVRVVQLTYLQIIAPIPIIMYMLPKKDGAFEKWVKQCITTFLDLFVRTAIICFVVLVISTLNNSFEKITKNVTASAQGDTLFTSLIYVCLVLGVMTFAKKAGDMLKELFPKGNAASGELGISPKRIPEPAKRIAGAGVGLVAAGTLGMARRMYGNGKGALKRDKDFREGLNRNYNDAKSNYENAKIKYNDLLQKQNDPNVKNKPTLDDITNAKNNMESYRKTMNEYKGKLRTERAKTVGRVATGLGGGFVAGTLSGANKGMIAGLTTKGGFGGVSKATKSVIKENKALDEWRENGGTSSASRVMSGISQSLGINPTEVYDKRKEKIEKENTALSKVTEYFGKTKESIEKDIEDGKCDNVGSKAREYRIAQIKAETLAAQAGNLKLSDFRYQTAEARTAGRTNILTTINQARQMKDYIGPLTVEEDKKKRTMNRADELCKAIYKPGTTLEDLKPLPTDSEEEKEQKENIINRILDQIADETAREEYNAEVERLQQETKDVRSEVVKLKKEAVKEVGEAIMKGETGDYSNDKATQYIKMMQSAVNAGSGDADMLVGRELVTYANLDDLNKEADTRQRDNTRELESMQQTPEYKAAQANKKYNENGQK